MSGSVHSVSGVKLTEKVGGTMIGEVISTCSVFSDTPSEGSVTSSDIFIRENFDGPRKVSSMFMIYLVYGVIGVYTTRLILYKQLFIYCTCKGAVGWCY